MSYYHKPKYYPQKVEGTFEMSIFTESAIYKNSRYKQTKGHVISLELAGDERADGFVILNRCTRTDFAGVKFRSYTPAISATESKYFKDGFFNATEEEKVMFGLIFNNLDAYTMCLDAFNEAEEFFESHTKSI